MRAITSFVFRFGWVSSNLTIFISESASVLANSPENIDKGIAWIRNGL